ncbi:dihydrofolate reductase family protein [Hoeflea sp. CAU 1731]
MRKLIAWNLMSLDGCFEGSTPWELGFHEDVWGEELEAFCLEQAEDTGALLFGRKTWQGMAEYWKTEKGPIADFMNSVEKFVASRTLHSADWNNSALLGADITDAVRELKQRSGKNIYVYGSADLLATLLRDNLVDEMRLCLAPVVLGSGTPLFKPADNKRSMTLLETRPLKKNGVILRYAL